MRCNLSWNKQGLDESMVTETRFFSISDLGNYTSSQKIDTS